MPSHGSTLFSLQVLKLGLCWSVLPVLGGTPIGSFLRLDEFGHLQHPQAHFHHHLLEAIHGCSTAGGSVLADGCSN